jgi:hypothetical protein
MACDKLADNDNNAITYCPTDSQGGRGRGKELNIAWDTNAQLYKKINNNMQDSVIVLKVITYHHCILPQHLHGGRSYVVPSRERSIGPKQPRCQSTEDHPSK